MNDRLTPVIDHHTDLHLALHHDLDRRTAPPTRRRSQRLSSDDGSKPLALTGAGLTHDQRPYPGVDHAVINDSGARYNATQATAALTDVENWFRTHLT